MIEKRLNGIGNREDFTVKLSRYGATIGLQQSVLTQKSTPALYLSVETVSDSIHMHLSREETEELATVIQYILEGRAYLDVDEDTV